MESRHLLNLSVQNELDCIRQRTSISKIFPEEHVPRNSLEKCAVRSPDGRYRAHIPLYTISLGPLCHKILRPPLFNPGLSQFLSEISLPWNMQLELTKYCCAFT